MAGLTHLGVGFAAKAAYPRVPLWVFLVSAYFIDIVWGAFYFAGLDFGPETGRVSPWSHGLLMAVVWTAVAGGVAWRVKGDRKTALLIAGVVFSHWIVDFIAKPMTYSFPNDVGVPLLFEGSPVIGLGWWGTRMGQYIGEYAPLVAGIAVYFWAKRKRA